MAKIPSDKTQAYSVVARSLHWLMAILIFWAIVIGKVAAGLPSSPEKIQLFVMHKSAGITVLMLAVGRLLWRFFNKPPALGLGVRDEKLAHLGHLGLYALMLLVPLSGWLLNSAAGYPFGWFNLISVPHVPGIDEGAKDVLASIHEVLFYVIAVMVIGHVLMLFHHRYAHKLNLLPRMLPNKASNWSMAMVAVLAVLIGYTVHIANTAKTNEAIAAASTSNEQLSSGMTTESKSPQWQLVPSEDQFVFSNSYSGEAFTGAIQRFEPAIYFNPDHPAGGILDVSIDTASITTFNGEWDDALKGSQWFATKKHPKARYFSDRIQVAGDGYIAEGQLMLKGITKPIVVNFTWRTDGEGAWFEGDATIDRREFNIGSGSWADDDSIAFDVVLGIALKLESISQP